MPTKLIHKGTGFIEFVPTETDVALSDLKEENKELKDRLSEIESKLNKLVEDPPKF